MRAPSIRSGALMLLMALASCSSPPSTTLTLDVAPPSAPAIRGGYVGPTIAIPSVHVPAALDRVEFVRQITAGLLQVDDFARWSAPLGTLMRDALIRDLTARMPAGSVLPPGSTGTAGRTTIVDVTVLSLDFADGKARMQAAFRTLPSGIVRQVTLESAVPDTRPVSAANAITTLIGDLADDIADARTRRSGSRQDQNNL